MIDTDKAAGEDGTNVEGILAMEFLAAASHGTRGT
jgi:hypothetical protein